MRVGIDARMLFYSGIGTYLRSLLCEYAKDTSNEYVLVGDKGDLAPYGRNKNFDVLPCPVPVYGLREQAALPPRIKGIPVFHSPHYNAPLLYKGKLIVTVHDIIHLVFPEYLSRHLARAYASFMIRAVTRKASVVITDSECSKRDIVRHFGTSPEKIRVIPLGVDKRFCKITDEAALGSFCKKYRLEKGYILYVGNLMPHKNARGLLKVFSSLLKTKGFTQGLVIASAGKSPPPAIISLINELGLKTRVDFLPFIPDEEMPLLYNCATLFVLPSHYEGFGLPLLEAMASGTTAVAVGSSSIPEVAGDGALLVFPRDDAALEKAVSSLLTEEGLRIKLINKGFLQAKKFSWERTARETIEVYEEAP